MKMLRSHHLFFVRFHVSVAYQSYSLSNLSDLISVVFKIAALINVRFDAFHYNE